MSSGGGAGSAFFAGVVFMITGVAIIVTAYFTPHAYSTGMILLGVAILVCGALSWSSLLGEKPL